MTKRNQAAKNADVLLSSGENRPVQMSKQYRVANRIRQEYSDLVAGVKPPDKMLRSLENMTNVTQAYGNRKQAPAAERYSSID